MEPRTPAGSPEQMPTPVEYTSSVPGYERPDGARPETTVERAPEFQGEQHHAVTAVPVPAPVQLPVPVPTQPTTTTVSDDAPAAAADEDLIEKEWVDSAKKIIETTKDDPHAREKQVIKLQSDYLQKRYGKKLGSTE